MATTRADAERELKEKAEIAHEERLYKLMLSELPGGGFLVRKLRELEERLDKLEES